MKKFNSRADTRLDVIETVSASIHENFGVENADLDDEFDDMDVDALDLIELVMDVGDFYAIDITDDNAIEKLVTVEDFVDLVMTYID